MTAMPCLPAEKRGAHLSQIACRIGCVLQGMLEDGRVIGHTRLECDIRERSLPCLDAKRTSACARSRRRFDADGVPATADEGRCQVATPAADIDEPAGREAPNRREWRTGEGAPALVPANRPGNGADETSSAGFVGPVPTGVKGSEPIESCERERHPGSAGSAHRDAEAAGNAVHPVDPVERRRILEHLPAGRTTDLVSGL